MNNIDMLFLFLAGITLIGYVLWQVDRRDRDKDKAVRKSKIVPNAYVDGDHTYAFDVLSSPEFPYVRRWTFELFGYDVEEIIEGDIVSFNDDAYQVMGFDTGRNTFHILAVDDKIKRDDGYTVGVDMAKPDSDVTIIHRIDDASNRKAIK